MFFPGGIPIPLSETTRHNPSFFCDKTRARNYRYLAEISIESIADYITETRNIFFPLDTPLTHVAFVLSWYIIFIRSVPFTMM